MLELLSCVSIFFKIRFKKKFGYIIYFLRAYSVKKITNLRISCGSDSRILWNLGRNQIITLPCLSNAMLPSGLCNIKYFPSLNSFSTVWKLITPNSFLQGYFRRRRKKCYFYLNKKRSGLQRNFWVFPKPILYSIF